VVAPVAICSQLCGLPCGLSVSHRRFRCYTSLWERGKDTRWWHLPTGPVLHKMGYTMTTLSPQPPPVPASPAPSSPMAPPSASNFLALVSFLVALYVPGEALLIFLAVQTHSQVLARIIGIWGVLALPAVVIALVTGHIALVQAKRYARGHTLRGFAIAGLVIGYLTLAFALFTIGVFIVGSVMLSNPS
jgi:hypothetical protein